MAELFPNRRRRLRTIVSIFAVGTTLAACNTTAAPAPETSTPAEWASETSDQPAPLSAIPQSTTTTSGTQKQAAPPPPPPPAQPKTNCIKTLRACGFPDASNTGWQHTGVKLTTAGVNLTADAEFQINEPNTVIDGKDIRGCVSIKANNVKIKRSRVRCDSYFPIRVYDGFRNAVIEDTEIDGLNSGTTNAAVGFDNYVLRRVDMHSLGEGPHMGTNVVIEDSYVHDLASCDICHNDAIQSSGALNVVLRHNTFINDAMGKNAVVRIATEQGDSKNFLVENNLLAGGNFAVQVRSQGHGFPIGVRVINNRIVPTWRFAPFDTTDGRIETIGNFRDDNLEPLTAD
ncbi:right-handed parallel beta-helix repeat-containing protein [Kibdelosporangium aridum]|uniref:Right handed beta helix region n=1 Tax=Kibdelosporangium aridum TaxID=2030 RepID=A0A1W2FR68_KIBAR|nr:hypothetical protein [Kibdelosporangium aridum]SMD24431.1 hypothetical protein SAMN05661093_08532 [Kibdelosporangium aridum]